MILNAHTHTQSNRTSKPKLDDAETIILLSAANREDGIALPVPDSITAPAEKVTRKLKRLIKLALLEEVPAKLEDGLWRKSEDDRHLTLLITPLAFEVLGLDVPEALKSARNRMADVPDAAEVTASSKVKAKSPTPGWKKDARKRPATGSQILEKAPKRSKVSKTEGLLTLLERSKGASLEEMMKASGWQAHSVRGFLSAVVKKKLRLKLMNEKADNAVRRYRVKPRAKT